MAITGLGAHQAEITSAHVAEAISRYLGGVGSTDRRVINIAGRINPATLHIAPGSDLSQNSGFQTLVLALGGNDLRELVHPSRLAEMQDGLAARDLARYAALWRDGDGYSVISSASYDGELVADNRITDANYGRSRFGLAGIPRDVYRHLEGLGFTGDHIMAARGDARTLQLDHRNPEVMHNLAKIRRSSINPEGMIEGLSDYQRRLQADAEYRSLTERLLAPGLSEDQKKAIREQILARERIIREESTLLRNHLTNPLERPEAREGGEGTANEILRRHRRERGIENEMGTQGLLSAPDHQLRSHPTGQVSAEVANNMDVLSGGPAVVTPVATQHAGGEPNRPGRGQQVALNTATSGPKLA